MSLSAEEFEKATDAQFEFLKERGFSREPLQTNGRECSITFSSHRVQVVVAWEVGSPPFVTLVDCAFSGEPAWWSRHGFGLHELVQERAGPDASVPQDLAGQAEVLRQLGKEVLEGDFRVLTKRQERLGKAVEANRD